MRWTIKRLSTYTHVSVGKATLSKADKGVAKDKVFAGTGNQTMDPRYKAQ